MSAMNSGLVFVLAALLPALAGEVEAADAQVGLRRFEFEESHMASPFNIVLYSTDEPTARHASRKAYDRIARLNAILSDYDPDSELSRLSRSAGGPAVAVSADLFDVLQRSKAIWERSGGAFDVTIAPVGRLWRRARREHKLPDRALLEAARTLVGSDKLVLDPAARTVRLLKAGMKLDVGGIAKGYAAQAALDVLKADGIKQALVAGAGDIAVGDPPPDARGWKVAIAPLERGQSEPLRMLLLANAAVSTAGDAERFVVIDGHRYSHIINPATSLGVEDRASVTVVAADGATADALETTVYILGPERGLKLVDETPGAAAIYFRLTDVGIKSFESTRFKEIIRLTQRDKGEGMLHSYRSVCPDPIEVVPEARIGFGHAAGVEDCHPGDSQAGQCERHRHPMVVVGRDAGAVKLCARGWVDDQAVGVLFDSGSELAELGRERGEAIRFLVPDVSHVADSRGASSKQRHHGQCHDGVRDRVHVNVDRAQAAPLDRRAHWLADHRTPHPLENIDETQISLDARCAQAGNGDLSAGDGSECKEITGGRCVGLDGVSAATIALGLDLEAAKPLVGHCDSERFHHGQRHGDIRLGYENAAQLDRRRRLRTRQSHEQAAQKLARHVALDESVAALEPNRKDGHGRASRSVVRSRATAQILKRLQQVGYGPLPHAIFPIEVERSTPGSREGRQEAEARARIRHMNTGRASRDVAAAAFNCDLARRLIVIHRDSERAQRLDHHLSIFAVERTGENTRALGQRGDDQCAVGQTFRAGNLDDGARWVTEPRLNHDVVGILMHWV